LLGTVEIIQVQPQFSIATTVALNGTAQRGDKAMATKTGGPDRVSQQPEERVHHQHQ